MAARSPCDVSGKSCQSPFLYSSTESNAKETVELHQKINRHNPSVHLLQGLHTKFQQATESALVCCLRRVLRVPRPHLIVTFAALLLTSAVIALLYILGAVQVRACLAALQRTINAAERRHLKSAQTFTVSCVRSDQVQYSGRTFASCVCL